MATFTGKVKRRPPPFPAYDHDDLQKTFAPLIAELRRSLSLVEEQAAIAFLLKSASTALSWRFITQREPRCC